MDEEKVEIEIYYDEVKKETEVSLSFFDEHITIPLHQAREMIEQLPEELSKHISQELYDEYFGKHK